MSVDTIVGDPERMDSDRLDDTLRRIRTFERERGCNAGVVLIQKRQFGGSYRIVSEEEANEWMSRPVLNELQTQEWGIRFYPRSYFEALRKELSRGGPIDYHTYRVGHLIQRIRKRSSNYGQKDYS